MLFKNIEISAKMHGRTFAGSQVEVKIDNVGAFLETSWRAKLRSKLRFKKCIRRNTNRVSIYPTSIHTLIGFYIICHSLNHNLRCPALVLHLPISRRIRLQQAPFPR